MMIRGTKHRRRSVPQVRAELPVRLHNRFDVEVVDSRTGEVRQRAQAENVICNALWTRLLAPNAYFNYIHYGTGTGTPSATDTALFAFLGYKQPDWNNDVIDMQAASGYVSYRRKIQLIETDNVGSTLTEVGIGYSTTAATLVTHAMLRDMNGNAISIAKTNTDIINIYATVFVHWTAAGDDSGNIKVFPYSNKGGSASWPAYGFLAYLAGVYGSTSSYSVPPNYVLPLNGCARFAFASRPAGGVTASYSSTTKTIMLTATRFAVASFNYGGFAGLLLFASASATSLAYPALYIKPGGSWFAYSSIVSEAVGTGDGNETDFATDFPFPYDATVYVDGVAQSSGVTVGEEPLLYNDMGQYFDGLNSGSTTSLHIPAVNQALSSIRFGPFASGYSYLYYNPHYSVGIASFNRAGCKVEVSNDLSTWAEIAAYGSGTVSVSSTYQSYKYWKVTVNAAGYIEAMTAPSTYEGKPIHFATPPASGAVITADYKTPCVAKDANHVFDLTVTIILAETTT